MGYLSMLLILLSHACAMSSADLGLENNNIFILAGQSNMAGRGGVVNETWDGIVPSECRPNKSILRLTAGLTWVEAREPLHADIDTNKTCGIGPGMVFANAVLKETVFGIVGLVPCALGGTNISEWSRGSYLYTRLLRRAQASLQQGGKIRALLWYQGESDSEIREYADSYKAKLEKFITDLRTDLRSPMLPVIQVGLASGGPFMETVRIAQLGLHLPNVTCVDAKGLALEPDGLHLTTPAQVHLGQKLATAFLQTRPRPITVRRGQLGIKIPNVKCVDAKGLRLGPDKLHLTTIAQVQRPPPPQPGC